MRLFCTLRKLKNPRVCDLKMRHIISPRHIEQLCIRNFLKKLTMGGLEGLKQEQVRTLIGKFYTENWMHGKVYTFKHFKAMNIPKSTIYRVLQRYEEGAGAKENPDLVVLPLK